MKVSVVDNEIPQKPTMVVVKSMSNLQAAIETNMNLREATKRPALWMWVGKK